MKKNNLLLTILILVIALTLCACYQPEGDSGNSPQGTEPSTGPGQNPTTTPSKTPQEVVTDYLLFLGDNFSVSASLKTNLSEMLGDAQEYNFKMDGNRIYALTNGKKYYIENVDESSYLYTLEDGVWRKSPITEDFGYPTNTDELITMLQDVDWEEYNATNGMATGHTKIDGNKLLIECTMKQDGATVEMYKAQYILGKYRPLFKVGHAEIYDIGTTAITLPENVIETSRF